MFSRQRSIIIPSGFLNHPVYCNTVIPLNTTVCVPLPGAFSCINVDGIADRGYMAMPPLEDSMASHQCLSSVPLLPLMP